MADIKVMVVDDSLLTRKVLSDIIKNTDGLVLAGTANDGKYALAKIPFLKPDVITMDVNMPKMDGITTLQEIMSRFPTPVIMVSAVTREAAAETIAALEAGAVDFVTKPETDSEIEEIQQIIVSKIKSAAGVKIDNVKTKTPPDRKKESIKFIDAPQSPVDTSKPFAKKIIAIGISTGGPKALKEVFENRILDPDISILIVQHMPDTFTGAFASRLNQMSNLTVKEAEDNDPILEGHVYIAPGHSHIVVKRKNGNPYIALDRRGKVSGHMPSADVLFLSVAEQFGSKSVGVIMTGMGRDGADGLKELSNKGAFTIAQNEATSVVFGMNREAILLGAAKKVVSLYEITDVMSDAYKRL